MKHENLNNLCFYLFIFIKKSKLRHFKNVFFSVDIKYVYDYLKSSESIKYEE